MINRHRHLVVAIAALVVAACGGGSVGTAGPAPASPAPVTPAPTSAAAASPVPTRVGPSPTPRPYYVVVAVGDSIAYNDPNDCPGCTSFVQRFADGIADASSRTVGVNNLSQHTGLVAEELLDELRNDERRIKAVTDADVVVVGIAHNDVPMNRNDDACDGPNGEQPDWSKYTDDCIATEVERFTPIYEAVFAKVADLRAGKRTLLRAINRYNDWNGWPGHELSPEGLDATVKVIAAWNDMLCAAAEKSGFVCIDVSTAFNGKDGRKPSGDLLAGDYTHPSEKGNELIGRLLLEPSFLPLFQ